LHENCIQISEINSRRGAETNYEQDFNRSYNMFRYGTNTLDTCGQTPTSGSNTTISGGYSQESTTTYASGSSSNTTATTNNTTNTGETRVTSQSSAPSMSAMSQDLCVVGMAGGISTFGLGISAGTYRTDENCERIKLSKVLNDLGMKVAAVSILCQDPRVFFAMEQSGTPCPFEGKIGKAATQQWQKYNKLRPDYDIYTKRLKVVQKADKIQAKKDEIARQEELKVVQEKLKKIEESKSNKEWKEVDKAAEKEMKKKSLEMKQNPPK